MTEAQRASLVHGDPADPCWPDDERALLAVCDALHARCDLDDATWAAARAVVSEEAMVEVLLLCGFYRTVAYLTAALRLPLEPFAARFPSAPGAGPAT